MKKTTPTGRATLYQRVWLGCQSVKSAKKQGVFVVLTVLSLSLVFGWGYLRPTPHRVAVLDVEKLQATFIKQAAHQKLSHPELRVLSQRFARALKSACAAYAAQTHRLLLVKGAVVAGGINATDTISQRIANRMRSSNGLGGVREKGKQEGGN